jgi:CP family cyanate transporter-like MFS transporter
VIPLIHRSLGLAETQVGVLNGLPVLLFAAAAVPGSLLIARIGARRALIAGLVLVAVASAARGAGPSLAVLFAATFATGLGISVLQPVMPAVVRAWFPDRIGRATAVYSNGLLVGELVAAAITLPFLVPLFGGSWELALAAWSVPVLATAAVVASAVRHQPPLPEEEPARWWPDWRDARVWQVGLMFGGASALYFGTNAFVPDYLRTTHRPELIAPTLTVLNGAQIPASLLVVAAPRLFVARRWPLLAAGIGAVVSGAGTLLTPGAGVVAWAAPIGFVGALVVVLALALPPLMAAPGDVHRVSAAVFTVSYTCSFLGPVIAGAAWDLTGRQAAALLPAFLGGIAMVGVATIIRLPRVEAS